MRNQNLKTFAVLAAGTHLTRSMLEGRIDQDERDALMSEVGWEADEMDDDLFAARYLRELDDAHFFDA